MAGTSGFDPTRIYVQLNNTRLQQKDPQLYQVIYQMIQQLAKMTVDISSSSSGGGSGSSSVVNINQFLDLFGSSDSGSSDMISIPGPQGLQGVKGLDGIPGLDGLDSNSYDLFPFGFSPNNNPSEVTITTTGNIDDLDFGNVSLIRMNNASLSTIRGLKAGYAGQIVTIVSVGAGQVDLAHQNTNSTAGYRLINFVTSGNSSLAAGIGNASYRYDGTTARWRLVAFNQGAWIAVPYNSGDYTADSGTWTVDSGDLIFFKTILVNNSLFVQWNIDSSSVSATPNELRILLPNGYISAGRQIGLLQLSNAGAAPILSNCETNAAGDTKIHCYVVPNDGGATWLVAVNSTRQWGTIIIEVQ